MGYVVIVAGRAVMQQAGVETLNSNSALKNKAGLPTVSSDWMDLSAKLGKECDWRFVQRAESFYRDGLKQVTCLYQEVVFGRLPTGYLFSYCTTWVSRCAHIGAREGVRYCDVPS